MSFELIAFVAWIGAGLTGGVLLDRTENIDPFAWPMALVLGPVTLLLGIAEQRFRSASPTPVEKDDRHG